MRDVDVEAILSGSPVGSSGCMRLRSTIVGYALLTCFFHGSSRFLALPTEKKAT